VLGEFIASQKELLIYTQDRRRGNALGLATQKAGVEIKVIGSISKQNPAWKSGVSASWPAYTHIIRDSSRLCGSRACAQRADSRRELGVIVCNQVLTALIKTFEAMVDKRVQENSSAEQLEGN